MISLNRIYGFTFHPEFSALDGVYEVRQILSYDEVVVSQIDMVAFLYSKVGKAESDYDTDRDSYTNDAFYQLRDASDEETVIYIPKTLIPVMPEINLKQYNKLMLVVDLGLFGNLSSLSTLTAQVSEIISNSEGVTTAPEIMMYGKEWKTDVEYADMEAARAATKDSVVNYYSETVRLNKIIAEQNSRMASLEAIILATQP